MLAARCRAGPDRDKPERGGGGVEVHMRVHPRDGGERDVMMLPVGRVGPRQLESVTLDVIDRADMHAHGIADAHMLADLRRVDHSPLPLLSGGPTRRRVARSELAGGSWMPDKDSNLD